MTALLNTFLFCEPMKHYLNYGSVVLHEVVQANRHSGQTITELIGDEASPGNALEKLKTMNPAVFALIGHGNSSTTSLECTAKLVDTSSSELQLFSEKVISLTSCLTAQLLGPAIIDAGATCYTGYKEEFWFFVADEAGSTPAVRAPFITEFQFVASLLQGKSTSEARTDQIKKFDEEIAYWTSGAGKDDANSMELSRILEMNKGNSVFLGEGGIIPSPDQRVIQAGIASPVVFAIALPLLAIAIYRELRK